MVNKVRYKFSFSWPTFDLITVNLLVYFHLILLQQTCSFCFIFTFSDINPLDWKVLSLTVHNPKGFACSYPKTFTVLSKDLNCAYPKSLTVLIKKALTVLYIIQVLPVLILKDLTTTCAYHILRLWLCLIYHKGFACAYSKRFDYNMCLSYFKTLTVLILKALTVLILKALAVLVLKALTVLILKVLMVHIRKALPVHIRKAWTAI